METATITILSFLCVLLLLCVTAVLMAFDRKVEEERKKTKIAKLLMSLYFTRATQLRKVVTEWRPETSEDADLFIELERIASGMERDCARTDEEIIASATHIADSMGAAQYYRKSWGA